jgi:TP901 family phage tail tape measure protein
MSVQINVQASQSALAQSIAQGVAAFNSRYAGQNQLNLQINARAFSQPLGRITSDLADFESALKASNARVLAFGASTAVLGGVVRSFKEIANVTIEVEKSLTDINRVLNLSTNNLQKFSSELFSISKQTASSFDDATKAALEFSRQGLNTEETLKRTADALTLVRLTGISSTKAVEDLTATINGFAKAGLTTSQVVNKLAAVEQDFAVSAADLTEALSRTGQAAQEAGVDFDELNALVTTAQQNTARGGAVIGNALKTIFTRLQRTETLDQLEKFNIIVRDIQGNILPAVQILQNFANKYNDLADAQRAQLSEQVAGVYQVNILKGIITDLTGVQSTYTKALERGTEASNEADIANQKLNKTLSALASQTGVGLQQLANNIGKVTFAPLFEAIVSPINDAVKYINDTLEGEGPGSIFANGLLKGIRNVIAGPGLAVTFAVIAKVAKNTFEDATKALPAILGLTTEAQKRANIEKSIISILQTQSNLSLALQGQQGNISTQAATVLNYARLQTAQYQQQLQIAQQLAPLLAAQNVTVGARGIQVGPRIKAGGHIPAFAEMSERMGAAMGGYRSGKVVKAPKSVGANTYMNSAEEVKYVAGFAQPFINPPANSKAGRKHRQNAINRTGVDPYMAGGFIPNFARSKKTDYVLGTGFKGDLTSLPLNEKEEKEVGSVANLRTLIGSNFITDKIGGRKGIYYKIKEVRGRTNAQMRQQAEKIAMSGSMADIKKFIPTGQLSSFDFDLWFKNRSLPNINDNTQVERLTKNTGKGTVAFADQKRGLVTLMTGEIFEQRVSELENLTRSEISNNRFDFLPSDVSKFLGGEAKAGAFSLGNLVAKAIGVTPPGNFKNKERETIPLDLPIQLFVPEGHQELNKSFSNGFIPNFALPLSTARIPWFKKYSSKYKNTAGDTDLFKMGDFPTYGRGLDHEYAKSGNSSMLSYLHEDFVKSAINIALGSKKIIRPAEVGFKDKPISEISNENDFDLLYRIADGSYSMLELKQDFRNISGSVTGFMTRKLENLKKENPVLAKKVSSMIAVSNMPKFIDPTGKNPAGQFSEFETAIAAIVKDKYSNVDPTISAKLTKVTDGLLRRYEAKKNTNSAGFIPNFASMLSASIKGKGNISAIKTGKNNYEIEGFEVGKKFRGQGLGSQLYRKLIEKIGPGNYITGTLLPQEQALADYASGKPVPAKAIFPQLSRAKMAKSSKLLVNRKEMAISDFEKGIASHKYNAAKLEMALIELITSHASGFIPNFGLMKGYAFNDGRIYDDIYHSDAWDSIVGPRTGAIKYANYNGKLVYQAKSISEKLKQAFISKGIPASAFSPVEDVDAALRSKNTQEINDKLNQIGAVQLSGDIKAIYERGLYTKLLKDNQSFTIPGGISPKELSIFGGIDNWIKYYEKHYKALKWQSFAGGFIPNFTELINTEIDAILQPISKSRTIASKKLFGKPLDNDAIRYLNATSVEKLNQYLRAYGYLDGALGVDFPDKPDKKFLFTKNKGFIPNFAYKQAVMGLEEGMSGNKAIFDTKPFPHIRNSSQPSFASAISDHGGLKNALNDSIKNQEAAGLMNGGYIPNFAATVNPNLAFPGYGYKSLNTQEKQTFVKLNQELKKLATDTSLTATQMTALKASIMSQADSLKKSTGLTEIVTETNKALIEATKRAANGQIAANNANNNRTSIFKKMYGPAATTQNQYITSASNTSSGIRGVL